MKTIKKLINKLFKAKPEQSPSKAYYFRVYRWMARLPISGNEKLAYAYIYGYNYHGKGYCYESTQMGGGVFGISAEVMNKVMDKLLNKGYLFIDTQGLLWCDKFKNKVTKKCDSSALPAYEFDYYNSHHIDYCGLIEKRSCN